MNIDSNMHEQKNPFMSAESMLNTLVWEVDIESSRISWYTGNPEMPPGLQAIVNATSVDEYLALIHPDDRATMMRIFTDETVQVGQRFTFLNRVFCKDGSISQLQGSGEKHNKPGRHTIVGLLMDVTGEQRQKEIRDGQGRGVRMLDLTEHRELEERLQESQKLEAMGQLTGGVAHDFNNLLTVILGNAEILSEQLGENPQLQAMAEMTLKAAERGAELTSRLLSFARRQPLQPFTLNPNHLIRDSEELFQRILPKSIEIDVLEGEELWSVDVDPSQLEVALLNLVINARDAMRGGGKLTIESANIDLDSDYAATEGEIAPGQYVRLTVSDTGCGMTGETVMRAFEPFFTTKEVGKGSGLGLSMVFGFVKQSKGHIKIYSEVDAGTSVKLYFPRSKADTRPKSGATACADVTKGNEHILIVEDDELVREHLQSQLIEMGYRVTAAVDGPSAMKVLKQITHIDLLLTDIIMPNGINGRQLADMAWELRPDLKVLFTSGYTENTIVHDGKLDADLELLGKPYRKRELATKVRKVLGFNTN